MLTIQEYVKRHLPAAGAVDFAWQGDDPTEYYNRTRRQLTHRIMKLAPRARLALAAGLAEWVIFRVKHLSDFQDASDFVEAVWASIVDPRYAEEWSRPQISLVGPVLGPQWSAVRLLDDAMLQTYRRETTVATCQYLAFLSQHVWKRRKCLKDWLHLMFDRLESHSPISAVTQDYYGTTLHAPGDPFDFGEPVARDMLDPDLDPNSLATPDVLDAYLSQLDPAANRFLRTPAQLTALGLTDPAYRYRATKA